MNVSNSWFRALLQQVAWGLLTLWVVSLIVFMGTNIRPPESIATQVLGRAATPAQLQEFVHTNGLNRPALVRYGSWLTGMAQGDWGKSLATQKDVLSEVVPRLKRSVILAVVTLIVSVPIAIQLGIFMARRLGRAADFAALWPLVILSALPEFVIGLTLITLFAVKLRWLPVDSTALNYGSGLDMILAYVLPAATLAISVIPYIARVARASIGETLGAAYARAGVLRGLSARRVLWDYSIRNAAVPILNSITINFVYLLGGVLVVENVFGFPGVGQLLVNAIQRADMATVQAVALILGTFVVVANIVTDIFAVLLTPRMRAGLE